MARTKGTLNKETKTKRQIQDNMKDKPKRTRKVVPRTIIEINDDYRFVVDPLNYTLKRKKTKEDIVKEDLDDGEEEVEEGADEWITIGYHSLTHHGLIDGIKTCVHDMQQRKYRGQVIDLASYVEAIANSQREITNTIFKK